MNGSIIYIDNREPEHIQKMKWDGALVTISHLEFGDVKIVTPKGETILIERKSPRDFLDSLKDRRLFNQVAGLVGVAPYAYVVINGLFSTNDGNVLYTRHGAWQECSWTWASLQGSLLSIQELGCHIVYDPDFHGAVKRLATRSRNPVKIAPMREAHVFSPEETILTAFPGIGSKRAIDILEKLPLGVALEWLTKLDTEPKINGIGKKTKQNIIDLLGGQLELKL